LQGIVVKPDAFRIVALNSVLRKPNVLSAMHDNIRKLFDREKHFRRIASLRQPNGSSAWIGEIRFAGQRMQHLPAACCHPESARGIRGCADE
jgi:hypothetical protein